MTVYMMTDTELSRLETIKQLDSKKITRSQAAELLGVSVRQTQRILNRYHDDGVAGLVSKKRGQPSNRRYPEAFKEYALHLIKENYGDFGPTFAAEKLAEVHGIQLSTTTLRTWMIEHDIWNTRQKRAQKVYQPRYRRECFGELVQIDGSEHYWFEGRGPKCTLLVYIDDATSRLMELRFVNSESTFDYFYSTKRYLERYGKPVAFYSDKHSVFRVNKQGAVSGNGMTQFGRALHELNIDIICANSSQAKGRVERANRTLQDRLVKELRLRKICTIDEGNLFVEEFKQSYNEKFAKVPFNDKDVHRPLTTHDCLEDSFSWQEERTVTNSLTVQYDKVVYLLDPKMTPTDIRRKKVKVFDYPDGMIEIRYKGLPLSYSVFDKAKQIKSASIVSNKRLGEVLKFAQEQQTKRDIERSKKAPTRTGQAQIAKERFLNPAVEALVK